jgi:hypothetical protein
MATASRTSPAVRLRRRPVRRVVTAAGAGLALAGAVVVAGPGPATAGALPPLKASLTLSTARAGLGQPVRASLSHSHRPRRATTISLKWGDHSPPVKLHSLAAHPTHRYRQPGRYRATLTLRSGKAVSRASAVEVVVAAGGRYSGFNGQNGNGISFFVSGDGTRIQDVYDNAAGTSCTGGGGLGQAFSIPEVVIGAGAGFAATVTEQAIVGANGQAATITRVFSGHLTGVDAAGIPQASGTWRDTVVMSSGTVCTSNTVAWTAARDAQPPQTQTRPPDGTYAGLNGQNGNGLTFHVAGAVVQNVSDLAVGTACLGGGGLGTQLTLASIPINANGSFAGSVTEDGIISGRAVTFTRMFRGNFHGVSSAGIPRGAGTWREDVTFHDNGQTCTSNDQTWSAERKSG